MDLSRFKQTLDELTAFGGSDLGVNRLAYTDTEREATAFIKDLCEKEGLKVRQDAVGNLIARREGQFPELPVVAFGSHIDSVYEAGKYDGPVGVIAGLEVMRNLNEKNVVTKHPLELIVFACEESARFGFSTLGSKAMTGILKKEDIVDLKGKDGHFLRDEFSKYSMSIDNIEQAKRDGKEFKIFLELHIEQGPVLESERKQIGIVTAIAAPTRFQLLLSGLASHSGTTPMGYRKDAFLGASEIALALEAAALSEAAYGTVATVGVCNVSPGAMNVVPGHVEMKIDIRGTSVDSKAEVVKELKKVIQEIKEKRGITVINNELCDELPVDMEQKVIKSLKETCEMNGIDYTLMPSGAGHDAMNMARLCSTGLIFIPSKDGLSHNPAEYSTLEQIGVGVTLLEKEILKWAGDQDENS